MSLAPIGLRQCPIPSSSLPSLASSPGCVCSPESVWMQPACYPSSGTSLHRGDRFFHRLKGET